MRAALRLLWLAGRGHRLRPWRSPYLRWRLETYSGQPAEAVRPRDFFALLRGGSGARFLLWCGEMEREMRRRPKPFAARPDEAAPSGAAPPSIASQGASPGASRGALQGNAPPPPTAARRP